MKCRLFNDVATETDQYVLEKSIRQQFSNRFYFVVAPRGHFLFLGGHSLQASKKKKMLACRPRRQNKKGR
jgi:hypothetical protein